MADLTVPSKPFWQSKTLWINFGIGALTGILQVLGKLPPGAAVPSYALTVGNFLLRFLTNTGLSVN